MVGLEVGLIVDGLVGRLVVEVVICGGGARILK